MATVETLLTAEEFGQMPDDGRRVELVDGRIVDLPPPKMRHAQVCNKIALLLNLDLIQNDVGHVLINDGGIITRRNPDTVRGADIAFYSYARLPKGVLASDYSAVAPELVIEVRSPSDRTRDILDKVEEYPGIGVLVVCVLDPESSSAQLFHPDGTTRTLGPDDELTFPECLPGFRCRVRTFFD